MVVQLSYSWTGHLAQFVPLPGQQGAGAHTFAPAKLQQAGIWLRSESLCNLTLAIDGGVDENAIDSGAARGAAVPMLYAEVYLRGQLHLRVPLHALTTRHVLLCPEHTGSSTWLLVVSALLPPAPRALQAQPGAGRAAAPPAAAAAAAAAAQAPRTVKFCFKFEVPTAGEQCAAALQELRTQCGKASEAARAAAVAAPAAVHAAAATHSGRRPQRQPQQGSGPPPATPHASHCNLQPGGDAAGGLRAPDAPDAHGAPLDARDGEGGSAAGSTHAASLQCAVGAGARVGSGDPVQWHVAAAAEPEPALSGEAAPGRAALGGGAAAPLPPQHLPQTAALQRYLADPEFAALMDAAAAHWAAIEAEEECTQQQQQQGGAPS